MISETVQLEGHIIDSLLLPKVLDMILARDAEFEIEEIRVGRMQHEPSYARIRVMAPDQAVLDDLLTVLASQGASPIDIGEAMAHPAEKDGVFPDEFYATTNLDTAVRWRGSWFAVQDLEMDCGIVIDPDAGIARCTPIHHIRQGDQVVVGHAGIRVTPLQQVHTGELFEFMGSEISPEKPKDAIIAQVAQDFRAARAAGERTVLVAGPAVVHTGGSPGAADLIRQGYINVLFAGNGLATHDIECNLFGTSLGVRLSDNERVPGGHRNHLRAINTIRRVGSIRAAVEQGVLTGGIMHACVTKNIPYVLAGSVRDDGPLPDVMSDVLAATDRLRQEVRNAKLVLALATTLHTVAIGNILPAATRMIVVDINPAALTKLSDRGSSQSMGVVSDAGAFVSQLAQRLAQDA